ncbi:MAG TPA: hypothetical protein VGD63_04965 [Steroidobacteraceae bacterium]
MMDKFNRRGLLGLAGLFGMGSLLGGAAGGASGAVESDWHAKPERDGRLKFSIDVATLGHTDAPNTAGRIGDPQAHDFFGTDARGDSFYVEGLVYPAGTIPTPTGLTPCSRCKFGEFALI